MRSCIVWASVGAALCAAGCGGGQDAGGRGRGEVDRRGGAPENPAAARAALERQPVATIFNDLGCAGCHGPGGEHHARLKQSIGRPVDEVVSWILDPDAKKPGTGMPAYRGLLEDANARELAEWVQQYAKTIP